MNKRRKQRKNLKISRELRDIIHGYIMSDGYVRKEGNMTIDQGEKQLKFVQWLYEKCKCIRTDYPIQKVIRESFDNRGTTTYSYRFNTLSVLHGFHSMWYKIDPSTRKFKKILPKNMECFFSPEFISLWFAGDGTKIRGSKGAKIEVTAFTAEDRLRLQKLFKKKYDISVAINRAGITSTGKVQWTLNINSYEYDKFKALLLKTDLIPTLFPHKLHKDADR